MRSWRSCRCRARCRASSACRSPQRRRSDAFRLPVDGHLDVRRAAVQRHEVEGAGSSASRATAICSSTTKKWTTCCAPSKASSRSVATARPCDWKLARLSARHRRLPAAPLRAQQGRSVPGERPVNLNRLMAIYDLVERPDLKYPAFTPSVPKRLIGEGRHLRGHARRRPAAAPSVRIVRAGDRLSAPGGQRSRRARDQADAVPRRAAIAGRRRTGGRGAQRARKSRSSSS